MADYGPSIPVCKLWQRTSANGVTYFAGRLGGLRVAVIPVRDRQGDDDATHTLMFSEAPARDRMGEG